MSIKEMEFSNLDTAAQLRERMSRRRRVRRLESNRIDRHDADDVNVAEIMKNRNHLRTVLEYMANCIEEWTENAATSKPVCIEKLFKSNTEV